jgi:hypothetical protein
MGDWFANAFGGAVADIRQKLIDEAWFGRHPVSQQRDRDGHDHEPAKLASLDPAQDHGIDR